MPTFNFLPRTQGWYFVRVLVGFVIAFSFLTTIGHAEANERYMVIEDNDFFGPGGSDIQSAIPLLVRPDVDVLGFTVVTGDAWMNAESRELTNFLHMTGCEVNPVIDGAVYPLVNTRERLARQERDFGLIPFKGAWGGLGSIDAAPSFEPGGPKPGKSVEVRNGAVDFLLKQVRLHPNKVIIIVNGPMTNIAEAIKMDPKFPTLVKALVFMGGLFDNQKASVTGNANWASDFNILFDPEAAHTVLSAPWHKIISVGNVANRVEFSGEMLDEISRNNTPISRYIVASHINEPMWDELTSAIAVTPTLVTGSFAAYMDADPSPGLGYGRVHLWSDASLPNGMHRTKVDIVTDVDFEQFRRDFITDTGRRCNASPGR